MEQGKEWWKQFQNKIDAAERDLGTLSTGQKVDLLLDNFPELKDSNESRWVVKNLSK